MAYRRPSEPVKSSSVTVSNVSPASLTQLPIEIFLMVLETFVVDDKTIAHLAMPDGTQERALDKTAQIALANLCATCKDFRDIVEPFLYTTFVNKDSALRTRRSNMTISKLVSPPPPQHCLFQLLNTLSYRPELANNLKTIIIGPWNRNFPCHRRWPGGVRSLLDLRTSQRADNVRQLINMREKRNFRHLYQTCDEDGAAALLLMMAGKTLKELQFTISPRCVLDPPDLAFMDVLSASIDPTFFEFASFERLESITVYFSPFSCPLQNNSRLSRLSDIFRLPNIKSLRLCSWLAQSDLPPFDLTAAASTLKELYLHDCVTTELSHVPALARIIELMVQSCSNLRVFEYKQTSSWTLRHLVPADETIRILLRHQQSNVERITLDMPCTPVPWMSPIPQFSGINLSAFTALKILEVPLTSWTNAANAACAWRQVLQLLPKTLEKLRMMVSSQEMMRRAIPSEKQLASTLPSLRLIELYAHACQGRHRQCRKLPCLREDYQEYYSTQRGAAEIRYLWKFPN